MLSGTGSTTVLIHHTNKSVSGGNAISASRGNNSLSGAVSWSVLLNWLCPPPEGQMQTDHRIACKPMGRSKATSLVLELTDDGWKSHGDGEDVIAIENLAEVEMNLQGRQGDVYDHVVKLWENQVHTTSSEVSSQFNISQQKALRTLRGLQKKGLLLEDDSMKVDLQGRPASLFKPRKEGTQESGGEKGERGESSSLAHKKDSLTPLTPYSKTPLTPKTPESLGGVNEPKVSIPIRTPVQKLTAGVWKNGYLVRDGSNPHAIVVEKIGNSKVTISNLRWNIDVRECVGSVFGGESDYEF
jgi:predicted transcriptional regulator